MSWRGWARTPRGQMSLIGWVYLGALLFAVLCAALRGVFFERFVYEKFPEVPADLASLDDDRLKTVSTDELRQVYPQLIDGDREILGFAHEPELLHQWLRGTIVTGNPEQRRRATVLLGALPRDGTRDATARYALERARILDDAAWEALAAEVLEP